MATSSEVAAGDVVQATDYNNLRTDVRATHDHEGTEGQQLNIASATDAGTLSVARGGTGAASLSDGFVLLGSGTGAVTPLDVTAKGSILVGDGTTDPVALAVGTNTHVLTADSAEASGTKWAVGTSISQATQSALEAETNENSYPPPDLFKHSPGVVKAYCGVASNQILDSGSYNVSSVNDNGTGDYDVVFNADMADTNYVAAGVCDNAAQQADDRTVQLDAKLSTDCQMLTYNDTVRSDVQSFVMFCGKQV